ncbi:uncharacterized protein LOC129307828 [Prosopis cineraria]|uniref:uncharacterized protein LOC129307828 n=1 Tax=Prosopis cineraria TaxID=364024 RepID=UPI00240F838D|nr:uncharacterized protein LOC129307828 [Prosopis cineraria]
MDASEISVRPFNPSDAEDVLKWAGDDRVTQYLRWSSLKTREEALSFIERVAMPHPWRRSICVNGRSVGYMSAKPGSGDDRCRAHISYALGVDHWGKGIVTEALRMAIPLVFKQFPYLYRIEALVDIDNKGSQTVLEKLGFVKEGLLRKYGFCKGQVRDFFIYSVLAADKVPV